MYWNGTAWLPVDPTFSISPYNPDSLTTEVSVTTERPNPVNSDVYQENFIFSGTWSRGRRVYSQQTGAKLHLFMPGPGPGWVISDKLADDGTIYARSGSATINPDDCGPAWSFWNGDYILIDRLL